MFRHVVMMRWVPDATAAAIAVQEGLAELAGPIPEIRSYVDRCRRT